MAEQQLTLEQLGWSAARQESFSAFRREGLLPGRVSIEDKHYYVVLTPAGELSGQVSGKVLHEVRHLADLPKVGDWVAYSAVPREAKAVIHHVLERSSKLSRKVAGREVEEQVLAANIDSAFVVQALDSTFNTARLQRQLVLVMESGAKPVVVLNKADLCPDISAKADEARKVAGAAPVVVVSAKTGEAIDELARLIARGETIIFMGSSGVGKSTLINDLCGEDLLPTTEVRERDSKGRHTTSWRELILLPGGGLVIDSPGMREFQLWDSEEGLREAFADIQSLAASCRFRDCTHTVETGCAVLKALESSEMTQGRYDNYLKLRNELASFLQAQHRRARLPRRIRTPRQPPRRK